MADAGQAGYEPSPHFRFVIALGLAGALILVAGLALFSFYEPLAPASGIHARVVGVFAYDIQTSQTSGANRTRFTTNNDPAAVVDWASVPSGVLVKAGWYDENGQPMAVVGPGDATALPSVIPLSTDPSQRVPAGGYTFVVGRESGGRLAEVLVRVRVQVIKA
jgi:hypothetical protein